MAKYKAPINNEEFAKYYNGDYEDRINAMRDYKRRVSSHLTLNEIENIFRVEYRRNAAF